MFVYENPQSARYKISWSSLNETTVAEFRPWRFLSTNQIFIIAFDLIVAGKFSWHLKKKNGVCVCMLGGWGEIQESQDDAVNFDPLTLSQHGSGIYALGICGVTWESVHAFTYVQYMFTLTHSHINACASINARLASLTSLCMAPYVKPLSFPLHSMHTISILLDDITASSLQW